MRMAVANSPFPIFPAAMGMRGFAQTWRENGQRNCWGGNTTLQINVGKLCISLPSQPRGRRSQTHGNHACQRARRVIELLAASPSITTRDIPGGAPELNPNFRWLV